VDQRPNRGPAAARNRGASAAAGEILIFVDSDVVVDPPALKQIVDLLEATPGVSAVFGAYNEAPAHAGFLSQYRNLAHSFVHQQANPEAQTFWAGLGAVRRQAFAAVGGFDERFPNPSVEDIDLGYRLRAAGYRIRLDHRIRGCHLKRWTFFKSIRIDIWYRGIPWTQLLLRSSRLDNDLNLRAEYRLSVICAYLLVLTLAAAIVWPWMLAASALLVAALLSLSWSYYKYFARQRGLWFAARVFPLHVVHHLCNGVSFVCGSALFTIRRALAVTLPGALPAAPWSPDDSLARTL
jgi:GT2 family glycosyltransferase